MSHTYQERTKCSTFPAIMKMQINSQSEYTNLRKPITLNVDKDVGGRHSPCPTCIGGSNANCGKSHEYSSKL